MKYHYIFKDSLEKRVSMFYSATNLFNAWLNRDINFSHLLPHSICCDIICRVTSRKFYRILVRE